MRCAATAFTSGKSDTKPKGKLCIDGSGSLPNITFAAMYTNLIIGLACYVLIGVAVAAFGPVSRQLGEAVADLREAPAIDDDSDGRSVSKTKVLLFRVVLSLAVVLLWGRFLVFVLRAHTEDKIGRAHGETEHRIAGTPDQ